MILSGWAIAAIDKTTAKNKNTPLILGMNLGDANLVNSVARGQLGL
jgi:hypothetical protein